MQNRKIKGDSMENNIYILSSCDAWAGRDSMRILGVTTDETMLYAMLAAKIKAGDIDYGGFEGEPARQMFERDFKQGDVKLDNLTYGFVQSYEDMQITEPLSVADFPEAAKAYEEIASIKATAALATLGLDNRSLTYSMVEVRTDFGYTDFLMAGCCDRDDLEGSDQFQEFMEGTTDAEVNVSVITYSVGTGESEHPDENELAILEKYADELDAEYGVDRIQSDYFSFEYEAEQEY